MEMKTTTRLLFLLASLQVALSLVVCSTGTRASVGLIPLRTPLTGFNGVCGFSGNTRSSKQGGMLCSASTSVSASIPQLTIDSGAGCVGAVGAGAAATATKAAETAAETETTPVILNPFYQRLTQPLKYGLHIRIKGIAINFWSLLYAISIMATATATLPIVYALSLYADIRGTGRRREVDWMLHYWAKLSISLLSVFGKTRVYGLENLPPLDGDKAEVVVFVPNHTTYFDILLMSGFVPRPFKYLSKAEILDIPLIGTGMRLAKHVFLKRADFRSTVLCAEAVTERLAGGSSMVLFAEGTRAKDGRLKQFKKGAFQMAKAAGVRIVPVSIGNLHRLLPGNSPLPLGPLTHTYVKIHPPVETEGRSIKEIKEEVFGVVNSGLPPYQKYQP